MRLFEGFFEYLVAEAVDFDVHLSGGDAVTCAGHLEVHVAEVVLVAEYVAEYGVVSAFVLGDKPHRYAGYGLLDGHSGIHESQCACAYGGHGR